MSKGIAPRPKPPTKALGYANNEHQSFRVWSYQPSYTEDPSPWKCVAAFMFLQEALDYIATCQDRGSDVVFESPADCTMVRAADARIVWKAKDLECSECNRRKQLADMAAMLERHGPAFTGNHVDDEAMNWIEHDFSVDDADDWCEIDVWDAATAAKFRAAGLRPHQVAAAAERMIEELEKSAEYVYGCCYVDPIYAACNNDLDAAEIIAEAKRT